jgi:hypothetical protein
MSTSVRVIRTIRREIALHVTCNILSLECPESKYVYVNCTHAWWRHLVILLLCLVAFGGHAGVRVGMTKDFPPVHLCAHGALPWQRIYTKTKERIRSGCGEGVTWVFPDVSPAGLFVTEARTMLETHVFDN